MASEWLLIRQTDVDNDESYIKTVYTSISYLSNVHGRHARQRRTIETDYFKDEAP